MYLIDTNIIIYSLNGDAVVHQYMQNYSEHPKAISVVTYGELRFGAAKSKQRTKNLAKVKRVAELFPVIELNQGIMDIFGELKAEQQKKGKSIDDFDLLIAATSLYLNYILVTNNEKHFQTIKGLRVENWTK